MSKVAQASLSSLQKWFQTFIVEPGGAREAVRAAQTGSGLVRLRPEDFVLPSPTLAPLDRLMIYREQYLLRMDEALSTDFPVLQQHLGERRFSQMVEDFVQVHPSTSHTLNDLGRPLPDYILKAPGLKQRTLLHDLCRVEWGLSSLLDEDEVAPVASQRVAGLDPDIWSEARVVTIPALRLLELKYPVQEWIKAHAQDVDLPAIGPRPTWLMLWYKDDSTWHVPIDRPRFELLSRLIAGIPVGQAMDEVLARRRVRPMALFEAFFEWLSEGLFCQVLTP